MTLFTLQFFIDARTFTVATIIALAVVFWYKTTAFGTFGWILWKQDGASRLSKTGRDFFIALFCLAFLLAIAFTLASIDMLTATSPLPQPTTIGEARSAVRNFTISTVVAVIIYGSRMMDAVFDMLRKQAQEDNTSQQYLPAAQI